MLRKEMIVGVSIILVVRLAIGVVSIVHRNHNDNETLSPQIKAVSNFCSFTHYWESCHKTLSSVNSTDPKKFISKAILAAEEIVKKFFNYSDSLIVQVKNNNLTKMAWTMLLIHFKHRTLTLVIVNCATLMITKMILEPSRALLYHTNNHAWMVSNTIKTRKKPCKRVLLMLMNS
ncbi:hypothetical protein J1N35_020682 [Gossypium stocksii]|uniref:Pectinesterase inhibitor domain-containing protein n=1 Tax=Gossypium stocksii TaxID=47602 RepID=A0A9D3VDA8_9ROSI|nr:hypothetical protein J1N35_020682 [Gossypium stocksii]